MFYFYFYFFYFLALPAYAVTRAFCKELLCETFGYLLLPGDSPNSQASRDSEVALQAFKLILNLAKEATSCLGNEKHIRAVAGCSDSGEASSSVYVHRI